MKLYYHPFSSFSRRVRIQLAEKGQSVEEVLVKLEAKEQKSDPYRALNPYGRVPTLVDDDFVLFESSAIMEYLEHTFPEPALLPRSARGRALVTMHIKLCDLEVGSQAGALLFPRRFFPRERWDLEKQNAARAALKQHFAILGEQLGTRSYLVEDSFSLADIAYSAFTPFFDLCEIEVPANVRSWAEQLEARASFRGTASAR
jgi:glutathione S-transferase